MSHKIEWVGGIQERMPRNVGKYDVIRCEQSTLAKGPITREYCKQIMKFQRVFEGGLQFKHGTALCNAFEMHTIQTHQTFVFVCDDVNEHISGEKNIFVEFVLKI